MVIGEAVLPWRILSERKPNWQLARRRPLYPDDLAGQHANRLRAALLVPERLFGLPLFSRRERHRRTTALGQRQLDSFLTQIRAWRFADAHALPQKRSIGEKIRPTP